ncbi:METTL5 family protein [Pyrobaculum neutrophilum]|uniref:Methyltransferase small n=1 Tax=Pyrobaculum neutrophilum (strain DSM 2338 / JCM 9278 / NBRC 100436 / V24Sta) TaxID=444157 RepID=B1YDU5_PYRNV|nr:METTL5 family protein [Pyrobaculum neutrophilum]ACB39958.1 methyltransferase small [Pyrobaculum neutrophilum V24Sta]
MPPRSKKELEIFVESIPAFEKPKLRLEQYPTDAAVVAAAVWDAHMRGLLDDVLDLGCGTGRFALAAAAMGARRVLCLDVDPEALAAAKKAAESRGLESVDFLAAAAPALPLARRFKTAFQNPPFGIWSGRGTDIAFLHAAAEHAEVVYTIHKLPTLDYVREAAARLGRRLEVLERAVLNIKPTYRHHRKRIHKVEVFLALVY